MEKKKENELGTREGGMWQLTSTRSQINGYANRPCYCSIAVSGPTNLLSFCSIYFPQNFHPPEASLPSSHHQIYRERGSKSVFVCVCVLKQAHIENEIWQDLAQYWKVKREVVVWAKISHKLLTKPPWLSPTSLHLLLLFCLLLQTLHKATKILSFLLRHPSWPQLFLTNVFCADRNSCLAKTSTCTSKSAHNKNKKKYKRPHFFVKISTIHL